MNPMIIKKYLFLLLKLNWLIIIGYIFIEILYTKSIETYIGYLIILMILSFPIGFLSLGITYLIDILFCFPINDSIIITLLVLLLGYYQWFVIVPKIINKIKKKDTLKEIERNEQIKEDVEKYKKEKEEYIKNLIIRGFNNNQIKEKVSNFTDDDINKVRDILFNQ